MLDKRVTAAGPAAVAELAVPVGLLHHQERAHLLLARHPRLLRTVLARGCVRWHLYDALAQRLSKGGQFDGHGAHED